MFSIYTAYRQHILNERYGRYLGRLAPDGEDGGVEALGEVEEEQQRAVVQLAAAADLAAGVRGIDHLEGK